MYPLIVIGNLHIYVFGIFIALAWIVFFSSLHMFAHKKGLTKHVFTHIVPFTLSIFVFGRIFYMFNDWREQKFIFQNLIEGESFFRFLKDFFVPENYNLSLAGGIFGFFLVFFLYTRGTHKKIRTKYLDIIVPSFLFSAVIGYVGALLWGQIYGIASNAFYAIEYTNKYSSIPFQTTLFPLPVLYIMAIIVLIAVWRRLSQLSTPNGYIGFLFVGIYGLILFLLEFTNGASGMFESYIGINLTQITGILFAIIGFLWISNILKQ